MAGDGSGLLNRRTLIGLVSSILTLSAIFKDTNMTTELDALEDLHADFENHHIEGYTNHGHHRIKCPLITHIEGNLWQGGCIHGVNLGNTFKHVISLYPWEKYRWTEHLNTFLEVKLYDSNKMPPIEKIERIADWVNVCTETGPTLVHCQAGLNRSALVAAIALLRKHPERTPDEVIALLREKRSPVVLCNTTFESFVREYRAK